MLSSTNLIIIWQKILKKITSILEENNNSKDKDFVIGFFTKKYISKILLGDD